MEKYENLGMVGEGSYGMVIKCKHKETGQVVAIKKFLESEDDKMVKKIAMREVKMLRKLRHENLVNLIEVFRRRRRLHLVFEFVDHTILDDLEKYPKGLSESTVQRILWQVLRAVGFIHSHNIIHRDIKPENILHSRTGLIKLCDFGFARTLANPGEIYTDYVATRWYRAPELLVGDAKYGRAVDVWAIGCLIIEMLTGDPLFPGDSDIDQLYKIMRCFGNLCPRHRDVFYTNPLFAGMSLPEVGEVRSLERRYPRFSSEVHHLMKRCMKVDPNERPPASSLLNHKFFQRNAFADKVLPELRRQIHKENVASCGEVIRHNDNSTTASSADGRQTRDERGRRKKLVPKDSNNHTTTQQQQQLSKSKSMVIGSEASWKKKKKLSPSHKLQISDDVGKLVIDNKFPPYNSTTNHHYNNSSAIPGVQKLNSSGDKHTTTTNSNSNKQKNNNSSCLSPPFQQNYNSQQQQQQTTTTYNQYRSILPSLVPPNHNHQHNDSLHPSGGVNKPSPPPHTPASIYSMRSNQDPWTAHTTNKPSMFRPSKNHHHHHQVLIPPIYHHNHHQQHTTPEVSVFPLQVTSPPPNSSVSQPHSNKKQQQSHHFLASNGGGGETASSVSLRLSLNTTDLKLKKQHQQNKKNQQQNNQQSGCDNNSRKDENDEVCRNTLVLDQAERSHVTSMLNEKGDHHHQHEVCDKPEVDAADDSVSSEAIGRRGKVSPAAVSLNNNNNNNPHNASTGVAIVDDKRRQDDFSSNKSSDSQQSHSRKSE